MQVMVHDINHEIMARAGLQSIGVASGMGRCGTSRALCLVPGEPPAPVSQQFGPEQPAWHESSGYYKQYLHL